MNTFSCIFCHSYVFFWSASSIFVHMLFCGLSYYIFIEISVPLHPNSWLDTGLFILFIVTYEQRFLVLIVSILSDGYFFLHYEDLSCFLSRSITVWTFSFTTRIYIYHVCVVWDRNQSSSLSCVFLQLLQHHLSTLFFHTLKSPSSLSPLLKVHWG